MSELSIEKEMAAAEEFITAVLPDQDERMAVLQLLVSSIDLAREVCPNAWSASLFTNGFRLNVGMKEVVVLSDRILHVNFLSRLGTAPFLPPAFREATYKLAEDHCGFYADVAKYDFGNTLMGERLAAFIRAVGTTKSGDPVAGSPHKKAHCEGLVAFAEAFVAGEVGDSDEFEVFTSEEEELPEDVFIEGGRISILMNAYERDAGARDACIEYHGTTCTVCGFDFAERFGPDMDGFIHVHHLVPLHLIGEEHEVDPIADLRPICPNCHAVVHSRKPEYTLAQVKAMLRPRRDSL